MQQMQVYKLVNNQKLKVPNTSQTFLSNKYYISIMINHSSQKRWEFIKEKKLEIFFSYFFSWSLYFFFLESYFLCWSKACFLPSFFSNLSFINSHLSYAPQVSFWSQLFKSLQWLLVRFIFIVLKMWTGSTRVLPPGGFCLAVQLLHTLLVHHR